MNIIVTGASRGIGYELVKLFSTDPINKIVAISRNTEKLEQLRMDCEREGGRVIPIVCDLSNEASVSNLFALISKHIDTIDIMINNAGAIVNKPFENITLDDLKNVYSVNVFSVVMSIQHLLPMMGKRSRTHIVNISSMGGFQGSVKFAGLSAYSSSKAALACLTECMAEEFREKNIAVNCLALGAVQTEMLQEAFPGYKAPVTPQEMAKFIRHFSLTAHNYLNGKVLPISLSTP